MNGAGHAPRLIAAVSILLWLPAVAACHGSAVATDAGHLTGVVYTMGGMDARTDPAEAQLTATPSSGDTAQVYTSETADDGSFSLDLPAGTYQLTASLTTRIPGGQATPQVVTVTGGHTTSVDVYAIYP